MRNVIADIKRLTKDMTGDARQRQAAIELALARAIAVTIHIPTSPIKEGNLRLHFAQTHGELVAEMVSKVNESIVINVKDTIDLTFRLWEFRYNIAHCPTEENALNAFNFMTLNNDSLLAPRYKETAAYTSGEMQGEVMWLMRNVRENIRGYLGNEPAE